VFALDAQDGFAARSAGARLAPTPALARIHAPRRAPADNLTPQLAGQAFNHALSICRLIDLDLLANVLRAVLEQPTSTWLIFVQPHTR
jgi:hypothetical protein